MKLTRDKVKKVAKLANLTLTSGEEEKYSDQLSKILGYIDQLNRANTSEVEPTFNVGDLQNVMRADEVGESLPQDEVLKNASRKEKGFFVTKGVFEEG